MTRRVTFRASRHILLLAALLLLPLATKAYVESNGLYYETSSNRSATLIANPDGTKYSGRITIPVRFKKGNIEYTVTAIGDNAFSDCSGLTSVTIGKSVKSIGMEAFSGCSALTSLKIPDNVTVIDTFAFHRCTNLSSLSIGSGLTSMGWGAFAGCENLTQVNLNNNYLVSDIDKYSLPDIFGYQVKKYVLGEVVTSIGPWAFSQNPQSLIDYNNELTSVTIPNSVTSIRAGAFWKCDKLTSVTIPASVEKIGEFAFKDCTGLTSISIPNSVTSIGEDAFKGCIKLAGIRVEEGNPVYDSRDNSDAIIETSTNTLIAGCKNTVIPNSVTSIGENAFFGCEGLTAISIPESVIIIGGFAFDGCIGLTSITIPNSVTSINGHAFDNCESLTSVISKREKPFKLRPGVFTASNNCVLYVPKGTRDAYIAAGWTEEVFRGGIVEIDGGDDIREKMDVNGDKEVSTADVTAIYSYIINGDSSGFTRDKANVNGDNDVNTADVTAIYNYIINGSE